MQHNLPKIKPYKKFFGREIELKNIKKKLLDRLGHIASIDGVGGIGKTALTYRFCETTVLQGDFFDYLVWISAKEDKFDYSSQKGSYVKKINNKFLEDTIAELINETIRVTGFSEYFKEKDIEEKKIFFENEILVNERIMFVIDNLESIKNRDFFKYIDNFATFKNTELKVLTTSRRREKDLTDNAILIEEIGEEDALKMLKYYAKYGVEKEVKAILNNSEKQNLLLVQRAGKIPLVIEFIVGQLANGKTLGEIYDELNGFPDLSIINGEEKSRVLSEIVSFSFKNMYEDLSIEHQRLLMLIAAWERNKRRDDTDASIDFLVSMTGTPVYRVRNLISDLIQNQLIFPSSKVDSYGMKEMAITLCKQFYSDFEDVEEEVEVIRSKVLESNNSIENVLGHNSQKFVLNRITKLMEDRDYKEAERIIKNLIGDSPYSEDPKLHHTLAEVYIGLNHFNKAKDQFLRASKLDPKDRKIWFDWINLESKQGRSELAIAKAKQALEHTDGDYLIVNQLAGIYKYKRNFEDARKVFQKYIDFYSERNDKENVIKIYREWKNLEYSAIKEKDSDNYFKVIEKLVSLEELSETKLSILKEGFKVARKLHNPGRQTIYKQSIKSIQEKLISGVDNKLKNLKRLHNLGSNIDTKKEANRLLKILNFKGKNSFKSKRRVILRILLQILSSEEEYEKAIGVFVANKSVIGEDQNCKDVFSKSIKVIYPEYGVGMDDTKERWRDMVSCNKFSVVIGEIIKFAEVKHDTELRDELITLKGFHHRIEDNDKKGFMLSGEATTSFNKLNNSILKIIEDMYI